MKSVSHAVLVVLTVFVAAAGCATGKDAVVQGAGSFQFVAPGGKTVISYDGSQRQAVPNISGDDLLDQSKKISVADYPNKVVVLNIWGSWCGPCRAESPDLQQVYAQTKDSGVQVIGVDVRDDLSSATDFYHNSGLSYPSIFDPSGRSLLPLEGYPRSTVPSTLVLDRQHRMAWVSLEPVKKQDLLNKINELLAQK